MPARAIPRQSLAVNLVLALTVTVASFGVAEGLARLVEKPRKAVPPERRTLVWDEGWHADFYTMRSRAVGWPPWAEFNRDGVRDRTHAREKPPGTWRVVCLGDSVTLGPDGRPQDAYPQILQARLDSVGPGVEVFNVSLWGWATRQERIAYERIARPYQPDQVILGICLNDFEEMQNNLSRPSPLLGGLYEHSALVRRLLRAEERQIAGVEELFGEPAPPRVEETFARVFAEVRVLREEVRHDGAFLVVTIFPYIRQVTDGAPPPWPERRVAAFCAQEGIPFVDPLEDIRALGRSAFLDGDGGHFNRRGGEAVAEAILRSGVVPEARYAARSLPADRVTADAASLPQLVQALAAPEPRTRTEAAWALGRLGTAAAPALPALTVALRDPAEAVRAWAHTAVGLVGLPARNSFPMVAAGLQDARASVRWRAAEAIYRMGPAADEAVPVLRASLTSTDLYVRAFAAWYLGELGPSARAAVPEVARALAHDDEGVRALAVRTLAKIGVGDPSAREAIEQSLFSPDWDERWRAARVLPRMGREAEPALERARHDPDSRVRDAAEEALRKLKSRSRGYSD